MLFWSVLYIKHFFPFYTFCSVLAFPCCSSPHGSLQTLTWWQVKTVTPVCFDGEENVWSRGLMCCSIACFHPEHGALSSLVWVATPEPRAAFCCPNSTFTTLFSGSLHKHTHTLSGICFSVACLISHPCAKMLGILPFWRSVTSLCVCVFSHLFVCMCVGEV